VTPGTIAGTDAVRILYFADIRFPLERANGRQSFETCRALAAAGHAVRLVVRPDTMRPGRDPYLFYGGDRPDTLSISRVPSLPGAALRRSAYVAAALARTVSSAPDVIFTRDLFIADLILRLPKSLRPPVVFESHGFAPVVALERPAALSGGPAASARKLKRLTRREARVWKRAAGYVTLTRAHQQELEDRFGPRVNSAVVPDGVYLFEGRTLTPPPPGPFTITYAGHLYPWKGVDVLVGAIAAIPDARLRIVGGQPGEHDHVRLDRLARELGVLDRVTLTGWLPPSSVAAELAQAHVLALPNIRTLVSERYTSPLKLFEYMAAGRPIVASNLHALGEVLRDNENALLVEPGSPEAFAAAFLRLRGDAELAARLASQAFDDVAHYGWQARADRLGVVLETAHASTS
jgi:glycosyltransferase involved in cell wall biosynthesis